MTALDVAVRMRALLAGDTVMPHEHVAWLISLIPALADVVEAADQVMTRQFGWPGQLGETVFERQLWTALTRLTEAADEDSLRSFGEQG